jgi:hypothetical protein
MSHGDAEQSRRMARQAAAVPQRRAAPQRAPLLEFDALDFEGSHGDALDQLAGAFVVPPQPRPVAHARAPAPPPVKHTLRAHAARSAQQVQTCPACARCAAATAATCADAHATRAGGRGG